MDRRLAMIASAVLAAVTAACRAGTAGSTTAAREPDPVDLVAQVRAAGETGEELEVQPLRDPQVEDLLHLAQAHERTGRLREADRALVQALTISPEAPDLLQWRAELALLNRDWDAAEHFAYRSWQLGPKVGGLCRRNWSAIAQARSARGQDEAAGRARRQGEACTVAPPVRM
ncbi:hypothetical protein [Arenimonas fontis]|uniref:Uncharacterized protein n=1 Tax=Arenimonas fontis TaxID=2608255 RepID=A0A5B2ZBG9_9GAMM|nr:hypothetical protein [Arenimonas fontis]KAA2284883.1 hypothetical protein F0415_06400 [Arenimonas fontis]